MGRIQDEIEDHYYETERNRDRDALAKRVKAGDFDCIVDTAYKHTNYVALIDARVLSGLLDLIKQT